MLNQKEEIEVGDTVTWASQAGGIKTTKMGVVVERVPANAKPAARIRSAGDARNHVSFVVKVQPAFSNPKRPKKPVMYWPVVSLLTKHADSVAFVGSNEVAEQAA